MVSPTSSTLPSSQDSSPRRGLCPLVTKISAFGRGIIFILIGSLIVQGASPFSHTSSDIGWALIGIGSASLVGALVSGLCACREVHHQMKVEQNRQQIYKEKEKLHYEALALEAEFNKKQKELPVTLSALDPEERGEAKIEHCVYLRKCAKKFKEMDERLKALNSGEGEGGL